MSPHIGQSFNGKRLTNRKALSAGAALFLGFTLSWLSDRFYFLSDQHDDPEKIPQELYRFLDQNNRESLLFIISKFTYLHLNGSNIGF